MFLARVGHKSSSSCTKIWLNMNCKRKSHLICSSDNLQKIMTPYSTTHFFLEVEANRFGFPRSETAWGALVSAQAAKANRCVGGCDR